MGSDEVVHGSRVRLRAVVGPGEHFTDVTRHHDGVQVLVDQLRHREGELALVLRVLHKELVDGLGHNRVRLIELACLERALDEVLVPINK